MGYPEPIANLVIGSLVVVVAVALLLGAVWFGMRVVAPRLSRALDRAEEDEQDRERAE